MFEIVYQALLLATFTLFAWSCVEQIKTARARRRVIVEVKHEITDHSIGAIAGLVARKLIAERVKAPPAASKPSEQMSTLSHLICDEGERMAREARRRS